MALHVVKQPAVLKEGSPDRPGAGAFDSTALVE